MKMKIYAGLMAAVVIGATVSVAQPAAAQSPQLTLWALRALPFALPAMRNFNGRVPDFAVRHFQEWTTRPAPHCWGKSGIAGSTLQYCD